MGLDISYYRNLKPVECSEEDCDGDHVRLPDNDEAFADRIAPLSAGCYVGEEAGDFRAGSYSGYNAWRNSLAALVDVSPDEIWENPSEFASHPFVELINFSDCEGTIGPAAAKKLAGDFAKYEHAAKNHFDEYGYQRYQNWRKAFEVASNENGAVCFH